MKKLSQFLIFCLIISGRTSTPALTDEGVGKKVSAVPYQWKNVQIVAGGFEDGIIFHQLNYIHSSGRGRNA